MPSVVFPPGSAKTATVVLNISPAGIPCSAELFLSADGGTTKTVSGGVQNFVTGSTTLVWHLTMPTVGANMKAYVDIYYPQGTTSILLGFMDVNDVVVISGSIGPITWS